ncbi:hypothetical protein [Lysobacter enzymogenes]|uniref:hypothetical protein n=1 Tax=Lysobacter enzymogenes TaxID=69 RepID=UPI001AF5A00D|nr:hypothetical protein [Lysobacter enzymogenes]QQQ02418.1 hypothetical protein JHW41_05375 [Lysobacter enzymogenes]
MRTSRRFRYERKALAKHYGSGAEWLLALWAAFAAFVWAIDGLVEPGMLAIVLTTGAVAAFACAAARWQSTRLWREYGDARVWLEAGHLGVERSGERLSFVSLADVERVRLYARSGRAVRLVAERAGPSYQIVTGLDNMDEFVAQFRRHAPQARYEPMVNE